MNKLYRFSPIKDEAELLRALEYIHLQSFKLCKQNLGYFLPVAGNIGIFCHYEDEFEELIKIRKELTDPNISWNQKYFKLHNPIVIPAKDDIPETTYNYLYVRKPDAITPEVGDADFYLKPAKYKEFKQSVLLGKFKKGVEIFERPDLDLVKLSDHRVDITAFVGSYNLEEIVGK